MPVARMEEPRGLMKVPNDSQWEDAKLGIDITLRLGGVGSRS